MINRFTVMIRGGLQLTRAAVVAQKPTNRIATTYRRNLSCTRRSSSEISIGPRTAVWFHPKNVTRVFRGVDELRVYVQIRSDNYIIFEFDHPTERDQFVSDVTARIGIPVGVERTDDRPGGCRVAPGQRRSYVHEEDATDRLYKDYLEGKFRWKD